jgi:hypothetical protein
MGPRTTQQARHIYYSPCRYAYFNSRDMVPDAKFRRAPLFAARMCGPIFLTDESHAVQIFRAHAATRPQEISGRLLSSSSPKALAGMTVICMHRGSMKTTNLIYLLKFNIE